jgi:hypothetical protein
VPSLITHKQTREVLDLPFCYLCGQTFQPLDQKDKDHIPPKACFAKSDRNFPLQLPTHRSCNSRHKLTDEKIGQVISMKHGRVPSVRNQRLKFSFMPPAGRRGTIGAVMNIDIGGAIRRWIRAFHAALYGEPLPNETQFALQTPFPSARIAKHGPEFEPLRPQHFVFVSTIKTNRAAQNVDRIESNNKKLTYECVWDTADDGRWACVFALDLYSWKDLGDVNNFAARGCAGLYVMPSGQAPLSATKGTKLRVVVPNNDPLDPFGR